MIFITFNKLKVISFLTENFGYFKIESIRLSYLEKKVYLTK